MRSTPRRTGVSGLRGVAPFSRTLPSRIKVMACVREQKPSLESARASPTFLTLLEARSADCPATVFFSVIPVAQAFRPEAFPSPGQRAIQCAPKVERNTPLNFSSQAAAPDVSLHRSVARATRELLSART